MVIFNELRIKEDRSALIVDCSVEWLTVYDNMYISSIELYHYRNTDSSGLPIDIEKVITVYENKNADTSVRAVRKCVSETTLAAGTLGVTTFKDGIFYVRVMCDGIPGAEISQFACGSDDTVDIGIVPDWKSLYDKGMGFVTVMGGCKAFCDPNAAYEQFLLNWFSIRLAMTACDFDGLREAWDRYFRLNNCSSVSTVSGCGCK
jgi:hypothetical protein